MLQLFQQIVIGQFEAAFCMMDHCIVQCTDEQWESLIAAASVRWAAYHTLFFVDHYLTPTEAGFTLRPLHAIGGNELSDELSPGLSRAATREYLAICREKARVEIMAETEKTLAAPAAFTWRKFPRAELHLYNLRHLQHHTGAISAHLRRLNPELPHKALPWVGTGWKD